MGHRYRRATGRLTPGAASTALLAVLFACSEITEIQAPDLALVVERDAVPFAHDSVPEQVLDVLAPWRVVVVGETHFLQEHREFVASLVRGLHGRGFRQVYMEWPHAYDWVLADYVADGGLMPAWEPPRYLGGALITAIRDFNRTLPPEERVRLGAVDVNLVEYGGWEMFTDALASLAAQLGDTGPLGPFLEARPRSAEGERALLEQLLADLKTEGPRWRQAWGTARYDLVVEMLEVDLASVPVRALREERYEVSARLREEAIKRITDRRLREATGGTIINIGSTHAQKAHLMGTEAEWLGDWLVHGSAAADGSVFVVSAVPARVQPAGGGDMEDALAGAPGNELLSMMHGIWPDRSVFLSLTDPVFNAESVPLYLGGTVYVAAPRRHYDAFVVFPLAHRDPLG